MGLPFQLGLSDVYQEGSGGRNICLSRFRPRELMKGKAIFFFLSPVVKLLAKLSLNNANTYRTPSLGFYRANDLSAKAKRL